MKVIIVYNSESSEPTHYYAKVGSNLQDAIRDALNEIQFSYTETLVEDIEQDLLHGRAHWLEEGVNYPIYCIDLIALYA